MILCCNKRIIHIVTTLVNTLQRYDIFLNYPNNNYQKFDNHIYDKNYLVKKEGPLLTQKPPGLQLNVFDNY